MASSESQCQNHKEVKACKLFSKGQNVIKLDHMCSCNRDETNNKNFGIHLLLVGRRSATCAVHPDDFVMLVADDGTGSGCGMQLPVPGVAALERVDVQTA